MTNPAPPGDQGARFRIAAAQRLENIEDAWGRLRETDDPRVSEDLESDLKYVQSHARIAGFADVLLVARRIEDIVAHAKAIRFRVSDEIDTTMTLAIQFLQMLARRRSDQSAHSADVVGFVKQIDDALRAAKTASPEAPRARKPNAPLFASTNAVAGGVTAAPPVVAPSPREPIGERSDAARTAAAILAIYLEHLRASGPARLRLREAWVTLARDLSRREAANDTTASREREIEVQVFASTSGAFLFALPVDWTFIVDPQALRGAYNASTVLELTELAETVSPIGLRFRKGAREFCLVAGGVPVRKTATRVAPAIFDEPLEIVQVDRKDVLLLRVEYMNIDSAITRDAAASMANVERSDIAPNGQRGRR